VGFPTIAKAYCAWLFIFVFLTIIGVCISLRGSQLISQTLKLTTM
jgi:hypothetical protein